jgi:hypothetical protein
MFYGYEDSTTRFLKIMGILMFIASLVWGGILIGKCILGDYAYERDYSSSWSLAEKASTIPQKLIYIDQFTKKLENSPMRGDHNAIILTTPDNSFEKNLEALKSLQLRLTEIQTMDANSFQYNTAISQITAQEQGEAQRMLGVFEGTWWKANHFFLWDWVGGINVLLCIICLVFGVRYWAYGNWS